MPPMYNEHYDEDEFNMPPPTSNPRNRMHQQHPEDFYNRSRSTSTTRENSQAPRQNGYQDWRNDRDRGRNSGAYSTPREKPPPLPYSDTVLEMSDTCIERIWVILFGPKPGVFTTSAEFTKALNMESTNSFVKKTFHAFDTCAEAENWIKQTSGCDPSQPSYYMSVQPLLEALYKVRTRYVKEAMVIKAWPDPDEFIDKDNRSGFYIEANGHRYRIKFKSAPKKGQYAKNGTSDASEVTQKLSNEELLSIMKARGLDFAPSVTTPNSAVSRGRKRPHPETDLTEDDDNEEGVLDSEFFETNIRQISPY